MPTTKTTQTWKTLLKSAWIYAICSIGIVVNISITTTCQTVTQRLELLVVATLVTQGLA